MGQAACRRTPRTAVGRFKNPPMQGIFSRTLIATLIDMSYVAVQLRNEFLDLEAFAVARMKLCEDVVPWVCKFSNEELNTLGT